MLRIVFATTLMLSSAVKAQIITESFGSGTNAFSIDFVKIANPGNGADTNGFGSVASSYNLGKYEISRDMITKASSMGGLGITLADMSSYGGNGANRPATGISWNEAARFVNWLNAIKGYAPAYNFTTNGPNSTISAWATGQYVGNNQFRHKDTYYFLPSIDEWYKGAYYDPNKAGGAGYWKYPTGSNLDPTSVSGGTSANTAVYGSQSGPSDIANAGGVSAYGTMGQGGNAWEWTETAFDLVNNTPGENMVIRGGSWEYAIGSFNSSYSLQGSILPGEENYSYGFRVATIPEPSSLSLILAGTLAFAVARRGKLI